MTKVQKLASGLAAIVLAIPSAMPGLAFPAQAQPYAPMPPQCQAASDKAQAEGNRYQQPPASAGTIVKMQHLLFLTGLLLDALDSGCRGWADYQRSRQQFEATWNSTMQACKQTATNPADCRRKAYGT